MFAYFQIYKWIQIQFKHLSIDFLSVAKKYPSEERTSVSDWKVLYNNYLRDNSRIDQYQQPGNNRIYFHTMDVIWK